MTIIIDRQIPEQNFLVIKQHIREGDTVIFQWDISIEADKFAMTEKSVLITSIHTSPGLMKGWTLIGWEATI